MITVGICKEIGFMAKMLGRHITCDLKADVWNTVRIAVSSDLMMEVHYNNILLLKEKIDGPESMFGAESCDNVSRAIACIDNKSDNYKNYIYIE